MKQLLFAALLAISTASANATLVSGFSSDFAVANWTQSPGTGSIDLSNAPVSVSLTSGDDSSGTPSFTNFYKMFALPGTVSFSWTYTTTDTSPFFDPFGFLLSNTEANISDTFSQLTDDFGAVTQSGTRSVFVQAGQYFGFSILSDNFGGPATARIGDFQVLVIPEPGVLSLLAVSLLAASLASRRRTVR